MTGTGSLDDSNGAAGSVPPAETPVVPAAETPVVPAAETPVVPAAETPVVPPVAPAPVAPPVAPAPVAPPVAPAPVAPPVAPAPVAPLRRGAGKVLIYSLVGVGVLAGMYLWGSYNTVSSDKYDKLKKSYIAQKQEYEAQHDKLFDAQLEAARAETRVAKAETQTVKAEKKTLEATVELTEEKAAKTTHTMTVKTPNNATYQTQTTLKGVYVSPDGKTVLDRKVVDESFRDGADIGTVVEKLGAIAPAPAQAWQATAPVQPAPQQVINNNFYNTPTANAAAASAAPGETAKAQAPVAPRVAYTSTFDGIPIEDAVLKEDLRRDPFIMNPSLTRRNVEDTLRAVSRVYGDGKGLSREAYNKWVAARPAAK